MANTPKCADLGPGKEGKIRELWKKNVKAFGCDKVGGRFACSIDMGNKSEDIPQEIAQVKSKGVPITARTTGSNYGVEGGVLFTEAKTEFTVALQEHTCIHEGKPFVTHQIELRNK